MNRPFIPAPTKPTAIRVKVVSYDPESMSFKITTPVIERTEPEWAAHLLNDQFDADDSVIDESLFQYLVGVFDEPDYFVGREFELLAPAR